MLRAPKVKMGGREGFAKGKAPIPALRVDRILCDGLLFTFAYLNFKLFFAFFGKRRIHESQTTGR